MADTETVERPTTEELWEVLQVVQDPELHMSIVDLGLVYGIEIDEAGRRDHRPHADLARPARSAR